jgi:hypothetical protein
MPDATLQTTMADTADELVKLARQKPTMRNAMGQDVPVELVKPVDKMRDDLVRDFAERYERASDELCKLKAHVTGELDAFLDISAERYGQNLGGKKGNVTLYSYDGSVKVQRSLSDNIVFTEEIHTAKVLIDQYLNSALQGASAELRMLVDRAFRPNSAGRISTSAVLGLRAVAINDPRWVSAMHAIDESIKVVSSSVSVRVYRRDADDGEWRQVKVEF